MKPFKITLFTKDGCELCDRVKDRVERVAQDYPLQLELCDITSDEEIFEKYKRVIPVVHIDGEEVFVSKMTESWLREELQKRMDQRAP